MKKELAIGVHGLNYAFQDKKLFSELNLELESNKIYGLLGKNGAGKSTLIHILANQLVARDGSIEIFGKDPRVEAKVLRKVCVIREAEFYSPFMKGKAILSLYQSFYDDYDKELEKKLTDFFEIPLHKTYRSYSRGQKSLLFLIIGLCSNAPLTIFDEPTLGLDAINREQFYKILLEEYVRKPRTFIISTHLIEEIENILEEVVILDEGRICLHRDVEQLKKEAVFIRGNKDMLQKLEALKDKEPKEQFGSTYIYTYIGELSMKDKMLIKEYNIELTPMSIQNIFVELAKGKEFSYE